MRTSLILASLVVAPLLAAFPVHAQDASAPLLSKTNMVLYAHHNDSDTEELNAWMNTLVTDPTGNDIALGSADQTDQPVPNRVYTITLAPALSGPVTLDPSGNIVIDAYIGAGSSQGVVRVSTELTYDGQSVASGAAVNHVFQQAGTGPYPKETWTVAPKITEFAAGKPLVWTVTLSGAVATTVFLSVSAERGSSGITFPVTSEAPAGTGNTTGNATGNTTGNGTGNQTTNGTANNTSSSASHTSSSASSSLSTSGSRSSSSTADNSTSSAGKKKSPPTSVPLATLGLVLAAVVVRRSRKDDR